MAKHTPGPWQTNRGGVEGPNGEPICAGQFNATAGVDLEACNHNLRLIAAAPDMLEACKAAVVMIHADCVARDLLRAAIAIAEGRS